MKILESIRNIRTRWSIRKNSTLAKSRWGAWLMFAQVLAVIAIILLVLLCLNHFKNVWFYLFSILDIEIPPEDLGNSNVKWWAYLLMGIVAALLVPFLTAAITNYIERRVSKIKEGRKIYKSIANHYVLIGYNRYAMQILKQVLLENDRYAIIMTTQNPILLRETLQNELTNEMARRVIIYAGDAMSKERISSLNLDTAEQLYLLDESEAQNSQYSRNLSVLTNIVDCVADRQKPIEVYMQINNAKAYNLLQRVDIPKEFFMRKDHQGNERIVVNFRPFNFYENWARLLWSFYVLKDGQGKPVYDPLDFEPMEETDKHVHVVIADFNSMGRALLLEALRICHYPNFKRSPKNKTIISVFDDRWEEKKDSFFAQNPYLDQIPDIEIQFFGMDINAPEARERITRWACEENTLLTIAVCDKEPDEAMTNALNLPEEVYRSNPSGRTRVVVRQDIEASNENIFERKGKTAYPHIRTFGTLQQGIDMTQIDDRLAICINGIYTFFSGQSANLSDALQLSECQKRIRNTITAKNEEEWNKSWLQTPQSFKWASRFQSDIFRSYIDLWDRHPDLSASEFNQWQEILSETEHRRWMSERTVDGWRQKRDGEEKDTILKIHRDIVDYSELSERTKNYDRNVVACAPILVQELKNSNENKTI